METVNFGLTEVHGADVAAAMHWLYPGIDATSSWLTAEQIARFRAKILEFKGALTGPAAAAAGAARAAAAAATLLTPVELAVAAALDQPPPKRQRASGKKCEAAQCGKAAQAADCSFCKGCCVARTLTPTIEHPQCVAHKHAATIAARVAAQQQPVIPATAPASPTGFWGAYTPLTLPPMAAFSSLQQPPALNLGTLPTPNLGMLPTLRPHPPLPPPLPPPPPPHQNEDGDGGGGIGAFSPFMGSLGGCGDSGSGVLGQYGGVLGQYGANLGQYGGNLGQYGANLGQQQQHPGWGGGPLDLPGLVQGLTWRSSGALGGGAGGGLGRGGGGGGMLGWGAAAAGGLLGGGGLGGGFLISGANGGHGDDGDDGIGQDGGGETSNAGDIGDDSTGLTSGFGGACGVGLAASAGYNTNSGDPAGPGGIAGGFGRGVCVGGGGAYKLCVANLTLCLES